MTLRKTGFYIGRFQPLHLGHQHIIDRMVNECDIAVVLVGSADSAPTLANPFSFQQRKEMIESVYGDNVHVLPLKDYPYDEDAWVNQIRDIEKEIKQQFRSANEYAGDFLLYGHSKDSSSYYLKTFPSLKLVEVDNFRNINATDLRNKIFAGTDMEALKNVMNSGVVNQIAATIYDATLQGDYNFYHDELERFVGYPYLDHLNFNCADALVTDGNAILLVRRKHAPGEGKWALPGGFKKSNESFYDAAVRELLEETNIKVSLEVLKSSFTEAKLFDSPGRSPASPWPRTTVVNKFVLDRLPRIEALDDAAEVCWRSPYGLRPYEMHDDHYHMIRAMTDMGFDSGSYFDFNHVQFV